MEVLRRVDTPLKQYTAKQKLLTVQYVTDLLSVLMRVAWVVAHLLTANSKNSVTIAVEPFSVMTFRVA